MIRVIFCASAITVVSTSLGFGNLAFAGKMCEPINKTICVIDGDTVAISGERIRIANIDAPEIGNPKCDSERRLGILAKKRLQALLLSPGIQVTRGDPDTGRLTDKYGRTLATIKINEVDVGAILIGEELARPWRGKREPWCEK